MNQKIVDDHLIKKSLKESKTIAMIGVSSVKKDSGSNIVRRPSIIVMSYLQEFGYKVIPVNPFSVGKKINNETMRLLEIQKDSMVKFLMKIPKLYYTKSHFPLEISQRAFDHIWRVCESYEMWCKETKQKKLIILNIID